MTEQKAKKKELGIYKRIVKWIGLGLLVLLLIAALFFHAPWKISTLLLIVLAACTVLPKPARKWFWLSAAAVVLVLIIWVFMPEDNEGWRPYTFDEELAALEAKYAIPDSENAATIYNNLLEDYDPNTMRADFLDPNLENLTRREPWSSRDYPELAQWLQQHRRTITKLSEASKVAKCAFPIPHDTFSLSDTMDYLPAIRGWAFLLVRAGNNDVAEGRIGAGLEKYLCVRKMGDHIRQQSTILEMLVGIAVEALALGRFKAFVVTADATEKRLSLIEKAVADIKYEWTSDFPRILEHEKLMAKNMLCGMLYEVNAKGKTRLIRDTRAVIKAQSPEDIPPQPYWRKKLTKVGIILLWFFAPSTPQKAGEIIDAAYEKYYAMAEPDFDWKKEPEKAAPRHRFNYRFTTEMVVYILEPAYYRVRDLYLRSIAEQRGTLIIIALRRYKNENGRWPETLEDIKSLAPAKILVDPINGNSFMYKLTEENFTLYSKGKNKIDEAGEGERCVGSRTGADDWLIWPRISRSCKIEEEKADTEQSNTQRDVVK